MNKELYESLKEEFNLLDEKYKNASSVSNFFGSKLQGLSGKDLFTTVYTFYETMNDLGFNFIHENNEWIKFYRTQFSNYLTENVIKLEFDNIVNDDKLLDTILKVCNDDVKKNLYNYAEIKNTIDPNTKNTNYYKKIEDEALLLGIKNQENEVVISNDVSSAEIDKKIKDLRKKQENLESQKVENRNEMFNEVSQKTGIRSEDLSKRVGDNYNIDRVIIDPRLADKLKDNSSLAASVPQGLFENLKHRVKSGRILRKANLDITEVNGINVLTIDKKDTVFDKIANCNNELVRAIYKSAKIKLNLLKSIIKPDEEVLKIIKESIVNANEKIKQEIVNVKENVQAIYDNARENYNNTKQEFNNNVYDFMSRVSNYAVEKKENTEDSLIKKEPFVEDEFVAEEPKENVTYFTTKDGRRVTVRAASKVGSINKEEQTHSKSI